VRGAATQLTSGDTGDTGRERDGMRECATCYFTGEKWEFSSAQWRKGAGQSRCPDCVEARRRECEDTKCHECGRVFSHGNRRANENSLQQHRASPHHFRHAEPLQRTNSLMHCLPSQFGRTQRRLLSAHSATHAKGLAAWQMQRLISSRGTAAVAADRESKCGRRCISMCRATACCSATGLLSFSSTAMETKSFQTVHTFARVAGTSRIIPACFNIEMQLGTASEVIGLRIRCARDYYRSTHCCQCVWQIVLAVGATVAIG
jgi:hypothetical protein